MRGLGEGLFVRWELYWDGEEYCSVSTWMDLHCRRIDTHGSTQV